MGFLSKCPCQLLVDNLQDGGIYNRAEFLWWSVCMKVLCEFKGIFERNYKKRTFTILIAYLVRKFEVTGSALDHSKGNVGCKCTVRTPENIKRVKAVMKRNSRKSICRLKKFSFHFKSLYGTFSHCWSCRRILKIWIPVPFVEHLKDKVYRYYPQTIEGLKN